MKWQAHAPKMLLRSILKVLDYKNITQKLRGLPKSKLFYFLFKVPNKDICNWEIKIINNFVEHKTSKCQGPSTEKRAVKDSCALKHLSTFHIISSKRPIPNCSFYPSQASQPQAQPPPTITQKCVFQSNRFSGLLLRGPDKSL